MKRAVSILVFCVLLAGCSGGSDSITDTPTVETEIPTTQSTDSDTPTDTSTPEPTQTETPEPTPTPTPEPAVHPDNPYGLDTLSVSYNDSLSDRDMEPLVREALDYWEEHSKEYAGYPISYTLVENPDADVHIKFEPVKSCGLHASTSEYLGCADIVQNDAPDTVQVSVTNRSSNPQTLSTLKHEIGHTLGLDHDDEPNHIMAHRSSVFDNEPVHIYLRSEQGNFPTSIEREVVSALEYFENHEDLNESEQLDWIFVDEPVEAHVIIHYNSQGGDCGTQSGDGSCTGEGDYMNQHELILSNVDSELTAYHVGYQIVLAFFDEPPEGLQGDEDYDEARRWPN